MTDAHLVEAERVLAEIKGAIDRAKARLRELGKVDLRSRLGLDEEVGGEDETPGSSEERPGGPFAFFPSGWTPREKGRLKMHTTLGRVLSTIGELLGRLLTCPGLARWD